MGAYGNYNCASNLAFLVKENTVSLNAVNGIEFSGGEQGEVCFEQNTVNSNQNGFAIYNSQMAKFTNNIANLNSNYGFTFQILTLHHLMAILQLTMDYLILED